jgi:hypothetical protein
MLNFRMSRKEVGYQKNYGDLYRVVDANVSLVIRKCLFNCKCQIFEKEFLKCVKFMECV